MLYKIFLFITVVVLSLTTHGQVLAKGLSWAYSVTTTDSQKQEPKGTITFSVNYDITTIDDAVKSRKSSLSLEGRGLG